MAAIIYKSGGSVFSSNSVTVGTATRPALFVNQAEGEELKSHGHPALDFTAATSFPAATAVSYFSSRGPSVGSALKPDLIAVGDEIVTGAQRSYSSGDSYSATGFINTAGTSFSAPLAAGAAAVLKSARPGQGAVSLASD